jgi:hypothetical protein
MWKKWVVFGMSLVIVFVVAVEATTNWKGWKLTNLIGSKQEIVPTAQPEKNSSKYPTKFKKTLISPQGNYLVTLGGDKYDGTWDIDVDLRGKDSQHDVDGVSSLGLKWKETDDEKAWNYYRSFMGSWGRDEKRLGLAIDSTVYLWEFTEEKTMRGSGADKTDHFLLKIIDSRQKDGVANEIKSLFFLGGDELALTTAEGLYQVFPEWKEIGSSEAAFSSEFASLPGEDGYAYLEREGEYRVGNLAMVRNGVKSQYKTPLEKWSHDYAGEIKLSPDLKYGCVTVASSGFSGYVLFKLGSIQEIANGQQYSKCERWVNERQVVVWEKSYYSQWNQAYYLVDVVTGQRMFLTDLTDRDF